MKLAWFTPFSRSSEIGRFSQALADELSKHVSIDLWIDSSDDLLPTNLRVFNYESEAMLEELWPRETYDFAIRNCEGRPALHRIDFDFSGKTMSFAVSYGFLMNRFLAGYYQLALDILTGTHSGTGSQAQLAQGPSESAFSTAADHAVRLLRFLEELRCLKPVLAPLHRTASTLAELGVDQNTE